MKPASFMCVCLLVASFSEYETTAKPFGALAALKKGFLAGLLKGSLLNRRETDSTQSFRGSASGNLRVSGQLSSSSSSDSQSQRTNINPVRSAGQFKFTGNLQASGNRRATRRRTPNANVTPNLPKPVIFNVPPRRYAVSAFNYKPNTPSVGPTLTATSVQMSNGFSAAQANVFRSRHGMQYGTNKININIANAGSGIGAVLHLGDGGTKVSELATIPSSEIEPNTDSSLNIGNNFATYETPTDSYLPPDNGEVLPSQYEVTPDTIFSNGDTDYADTKYDTFNTAVQSETDNEVNTNVDYDYNYTPTDDNSSPDYAVIDSENESTSTSDRNPLLSIDFSASGSGSISSTNNFNAEANANIDASLAAHGFSNTFVENEDFVGSTDTFDEGDETIGSYDYTDGTVSGSTFDSYVPPDTSYLPPNYDTTSTSDTNPLLSIDFSASGSGSISSTNNFNAEANANIDASLTAHEFGNTFVDNEDFVGSTDTFEDGDETIGSYDYTDDTVSGSTFDSYVPPDTSYLPPDYDTTLDGSETDSNVDTYYTSDTTEINVDPFFATDTTGSNVDPFFTGDDSYILPNDTIPGDTTTDNTSSTYFPPGDSYLPPVEDTHVDNIITFEENNTGNEANVAGPTTGTILAVEEPVISTSGVPSTAYDSYIKTNIEAVRALSNIALQHGSGLPVTIRLRTRHSRVRQRPDANNNQYSWSSGGQTPTDHSILSLFGDSSGFEVSKAPLLYKYSDVIESPDAVQPSSSVSDNNEVIYFSDSEESQQLSATANLNLNLNANIGFGKSRSIAGGRMRIELPHPSQREQRQSPGLRANIGKTIPSINNTTNTNNKNIENTIPNESSKNPQRQNNTNIMNPNARKLVPLISMENKNKVTIPQRRIHSQMNTNTRFAQRRTTLPQMQSNNRQHTRGRVRNRTPTPTRPVDRRQKIINLQSQHLRNTAGQRRPSNINRQPITQSRTRNNTKSRPPQNQNNRRENKKSISSSSRNRQSSFVEMLAQFAEAHRLSLLRNRQQSQKSSLTSSRRLSRVRSNSERTEFNEERTATGNGKSFLSGNRSFISSLDRKENSGVTRARLRFRHRETIPSPDRG